MLGHFVDIFLNLSPAILGVWGYIIVFLISIIESLPFIGLAVPGGVVVIASGFFAKIGILNLPLTIAIVFAGAFIGDNISFFLGRKYGDRFLLQIGKYIFFKTSYFEKAKKMLGQHSRKSIFVGRFHALTRCVIPFVAGSAGTDTRLFLVFSGLSCGAWALLNVSIGYVFGSGFEIASRYLGVVFFVALILSVLMVYSYEFIGRFTKKNKHLLSRYQIYPLLLNIISIYVIAKIATLVISTSKLRRIDLAVNYFFSLIRQPFFTKIFVAITIFATPTNLVIVSLALMVYFIYRHRWYFLALLPASLISGIISDSILKKIIHIARPPNPIFATADFSFPSAHATVSVIFCGLLAYFFKDHIKTKIGRRVYLASCALAVLIVCVSRLYLNVHWFSDVCAGAMLGLFWLTFYIVLFHFFNSFVPRKAGQEFASELKNEQDVII